MLKQDNSYMYKIHTERYDKTDDDCLRKMFIGGLSPMTTEESLRTFFSHWGEVVDVVVMRDINTKRSRGFGFVTYADSAMVDRAQANRPHTIDGKIVDSKRALPRGESNKAETPGEVKKIFVGGLKENHDEESLIEHFSQFGTVVSARILTDKTSGRKRGFAFVEFDDYDAVDKAILYKNHTIKYVMVDVKKSMYKQEQARKIQTQQQNSMMMPVTVAPNVAPGGYLPTGNYNPNAPYGYATQLPPPHHYNWNNYSATPYQQATSYGYSMPAVNGQAAAWPAYGNQQTWDQNGMQAAAQPVAHVPSVPSPGPNGWETHSPKAFGSYQQTYNGGPQKTGNLQANRVNPYNVASISNYGSPSISMKSYKYQRFSRKTNIA